MVVGVDERGKPYLPTYYTSRIYIDCTDEFQFSVDCEQLLRGVFGKSMHKRPELGMQPAYLSYKGDIISMSNRAQKRRAYDAITKSREHAYPVTIVYVELFTEELENVRLDANVNWLDNSFLPNSDLIVPYLDECLDVVRAIALYTQDDRYANLLFSCSE